MQGCENEFGGGQVGEVGEEVSLPRGGRTGEVGGCGGHGGEEGAEAEGGACGGGSYGCGIGWVRDRVGGAGAESVAVSRGIC